MPREYQICTRCIMDTSDPDITFDQNGYCNHCTQALIKLNKNKFANDDERLKHLNRIINKIKKSGKNKKYDCIIGLSGGVDSSYLAYIVVKKLGLRPLAVHVDNGWNSELSVKNIENIVKKLGIDLYTYVIDWEEFKDLQRAYLKASVIDIEVLSDNAIVIAIHKLLKKYKLKYFLIGYNYQTESIMPASWLYSNKFDSLNIKSIYKKFGTGLKLKTYPLLSFWEYIVYRFFDKSRSINILDLFPYNKQDAINILHKELDWQDYGGKHYESKITKIYQGYILPKKFNIDKRRAHLSSLFVSGQISREEALEKIKENLYEEKELKEDIEFFCKKLDIFREEFDEILSASPIPHYAYPSYNKIIDRLIALKRKVFSL